MSQKEENTEFLIQNYLPTKQLPMLENAVSVEKLGGQLSKMVYEAKEAILLNEVSKEKKGQEIDNLLKLAKSVKRNNNV